MLTDDHVEFVRPPAWLTRGEVGALYQQARVVVLPSIYEAFGMTALEALACQRPVVASRTGGLPEIIEHNVNGLLFEPRDECDLARGLIALLSDPELRERLGAAGRGAAERRGDVGPDRGAMRAAVSRSSCEWRWAGFHPRLWT